MMLDNTTSAISHIRSGQLRGLAVGEKQRITALPDLPPINESGVPGFEVSPWFALGTRTGVPKEIVNKMNTCAVGAINNVDNQTKKFYNGPSSSKFALGISEPTVASGSNVIQSPPTSSDAWYPSAAMFQDDPYYLRNSLLSPFSLKPHIPQKTFPNEDNGLFSSAEGTQSFMPNNLLDKYASV